MLRCMEKSKPVYHAIEYEGKNTEEVVKFIEDAKFYVYKYAELTTKTEHRRVNIGDVIVKGSQGELEVYTRQEFLDKFDFMEE